MNPLSEFKSYLFSPPRVGEPSESRRVKKPLSKLTVKNYLCDLRKFIAWFEEDFNSSFSPELITPQIIDHFKQSSNLAMSSIERNLSSLRKFFNFLKLEGVIPSSPFEQKTLSSEALAKEDPYHLKDFKNYLYIYNASRLTIKNYLMDIKKFTAWLEQVANTKDAWDIKGKDILGKIDENLINEYKRRLVQRSLGEVGYSPRTVNRKLSSLRKYLNWAQEEGLVEARGGEMEGLLTARTRSARRETSGALAGGKPRQDPERMRVASPRAYSKFPPLRLIQKITRGLILIPELIFINPLAFAVKGFEYLSWKIKGKPVFQRIRPIRSIRSIRNFPKELYAPLLISTKNFSFYKKLIFSLRHNRPRWYKTYHSYALSHYLHIAILVMIMSAVGFGLYQNLNEKPLNRGVLGIDNPKSPSRIFSFQGKLTDSSGNPITSATSLRFGIYNSITGTGSALMWQEVNSVTPDSDGIFSVLLGTISTMQQSMFAEHAGLWLGVTVGKTAELTPRQQLATVAFAQNSDTLEGLPPITNVDAGTKNVVLALDSSGNLTIGGTATPSFQATGGKFTLSGNILLLTTLAGSNSDIIASPSGLGKIDLNKPIRNTSNNNNLSSAVGAVEVDDLFAILATSSGQSAFTVNQNSTGPILSASSSGTAKFTVGNSGDITTAGNFSQTGATTFSTGTGAISLNGAVTAGSTLAVTGATTLTGALTANGAVNLGDATADDIAVNGRITTSFVPKLTANVDIGSTSLRWNNLWVQTINTTGTNTSGQATFTSSPATTAISDSTVFINPTTASADVALLGVAIAGAEKARIDAEGDLILGYNSATATLASDPFNVYNHGTTRVASITTAGALSLSGAITAPTSTNTINSLIINAGALSAVTGYTQSSGNFAISGTGTFGTGTGAISLNGDTTLATNKNLTLSGTAVIANTYSNTTGSALNVSATNSSSSGAGNTVNLLNATLAGTANAAGSNIINGVNFQNVTAATNNSFYGLNFGTGYTDILRYNSTQIISGTGILQSAALSGTYSNALTLSSATNSITAGTLTATGGTINGTSVGATTPSTGAFTTLSASSTLTASNGLTLTTGALSLTGTSGSIGLTGFGTTSITSTTASGNIFTLADTSFTTTGANLANLTFTNTNSGAGAVTTSGLSVTPTGTAIIGGGSNTLNSINLPSVTAIASNTFSGINFGTGYTDILRYNSAQIISGTGILQSAGLSGTYSNALTLSSATNAITAGTLTATGGTVNGTTIGATTASTGAFTTLTSSGATTLGTGTSLTNTFGSGASSINTIGSTTTPGTLTLHGATTLDNTFTVSGSNLTSLGGNLTVTGTTWTATPTISGLITATSGLTSNGTLTVSANQNLTLVSGTGVYSQTFSGTTQTPFSLTSTFAPTAGGTQNNINTSITNSATTTANTLRGLNMVLTDNSTALANTDIGLNVDVSAGTNASATRYAALFNGGNVGIGTVVPSGILSVTPTQYSTGTASQSLTTITGVDTTFTSAMVGSQFVFANGTSAGTITAFGSITSLTVSTSQTVTSQAYNIAYTGLQVGSTGNVGIGTTSPGAQLQVNAALATTIGTIIKGQTSQSADLLRITDSLNNILAKVDNLGNLTANTLTSSVAQGTAPLTVTSNTVVANLNAAAAQEPMPNLVLNSDFGRRNKWMTFMPEVFSDTAGWTLRTGTSIGTVASNILTAGNTGTWEIRAGLSTWRDVRMSAQFKNVDPLAAVTRAGIVRSVDVNNFIQIIWNQDTFYLQKMVAGTFIQVTNVGVGNGVQNNWYWIELERQGTTYIAKLYSSGASPVTKASATLVATLNATIADGVFATGTDMILVASTTNASQWGGLATGDGGVYVEGWGPESWDVGYSGTLGGQAIGFDETADAGPTTIGKQWTIRAYIPAASRSVNLSQQGPDGGLPPSTSITQSGYMKVSGKGGSGALISYQYARRNSAGTDQGSSQLDDAGETSWIQKQASVTSEVGTRRFFVRLNINALATATGTAFVDLPQIEQGSVATPWRNAPADDGPIVWVLDKSPMPRSTATTSEWDSRDLAINAFLPFDGMLEAAAESPLEFSVANNRYGTSMTLDGADMKGNQANGRAASFQGATAGQYLQHSISRRTTVAAGKHRVAWKAEIIDAGTITMNNAGSFYSGMMVTLTRGKFDLAEEYSVNDPTIGAGDVVQLASNNLQFTSNTTIEKSTGAYSSKILGIVSTDPNIVLGNTQNDGGTIDTSSNRYTTGTNLRPVALSGRVPVKVTNENGPILRGDILTSSEKYPGYAMKAIKAGRSIGIAMDDFVLDGTIGNVQFGKIMTFVNLSFYDPDVYLTSTGDFVINKVISKPQVLADSNDVLSSMYQVLSGSETKPIPNCEQTTDPSNFGLISTCPTEPTLAEKAVQQINSVTYAVSDSLGNTIQRVGVFSQAVIGSLKTGVIDAKDIITDNLIINNKIISPIAEVKIVKTDTIIPLSSDKIVIRPNETSASESAVIKPILEIQNASGSAVATIDTAGNVYTEGNLTARSATFSGTLNSFGLVTESASISGTLRTKNLIADNIESQVAGIKSLIAGFSNPQASPSLQLGLQLSASQSAALAYIDNLNAVTAIFTQGFSSLGPASLTDTSVSGQLSIGATLILADNSINVLGADLQIQPLKQGGVSFLSGKVYIDVGGNLTINGNATFKGTLFAGLISPIPNSDLIIRLGSSDQSLEASSSSRLKALGSRLLIQNASGSAVASIDSEGAATFRKINIGGLVSPAFALSEHEILATGSAGVATISAKQSQLTVRNKLVTEKSLIYISPVGTPSTQIPFLLRQTAGNSFTVGTQNININDLPFNWLIIN